MAPKALIVDDSTATRFILAKMLREIGFESVQAEDGQKALDVLRANKEVTLALVDWNMPVMNGLDFIIELRKNSDYSNMKVVMVTTETEMMQVVRAIEAGANEYLMKPFTKDMVLDKMKLMGLGTDS
jgi:two-component system chemotaxis response regulator CheY